MAEQEPNKEQLLIVNLSGRGDKDIFTVHDISQQRRNLMERYTQLFEHLAQKNQGAFVPFVTLGDPDAELSLKIVDALIAGGADALEIGIPFSDPLADGPTIQMQICVHLKVKLPQQFVSNYSVVFEKTPYYSYWLISLCKFSFYEWY